MTAQTNQPAKFLVPFAQNDSSRVELPVTTADATRASQSLGFPPSTMQPPEAGGVPPQGEDFNGALNQVARIAWWLMLGGQFPFDSAFATATQIGGYPKGAALQSADALGSWISTADNNSANPDTSTDPAGGGYVPGYQYGTTALTGLTGGTVTLTNAQAAKATVTLAGALTSALTLVVPTWLKHWTVTNNTTGAFAATIKTAAGTGIAIPQNGAPTPVVGDGANIVQVGENIAQATRLTQGVRLDQLYGTAKGFLRATSSGSTTVPPNVTTIYVSGSAGGAGGGGCATVGTPNIMSGAGGGGAGQFTEWQALTVVPGETLTYTIGGAGNGGAPNVPGGAGGNTTITGSVSGLLLSLTGGVGGSPGVGGAYSVYTAGGNGGAGAPAGGYGQDTGPQGVGANGGAGGSNPFGGGGTAVRGSQIGNTMLAGLAATGYGCGGGGCGGVYAAGNTTIPTSTGNSGGAGTPGVLLFAW
ncbi:tail fiber protein [Burkholderia phage BcepNY3]|uniref:Tail fiber protein n=1 Tax=Burkholderia phage BcepNY3 TaxID=2881397 RepID=A6N3D8_9CAUD|nr:tail fiber protein [Burkholderia phage BcepNY3]ABR10565.1 tail fiber protein [Burkholderia phage BcepNY3]